MTTFTRARGVRGGALGAGAVVLLVLGAAGGQAIASAVVGQSGPSRAQIAATLPPVQTNEAGQTFGSVVHAESAETAPDLILVTGDSGKDGYVYRDELYGDAPASPQEALAQQERESLEGPTVLTVYESDGVTAIDTFTFAVPK